MDKSTHEIRLAHWKQIIEQCQSRPKEQTAKQWLEEVHVYVGTDGDHQDEFLRGDRPRDLLRNSILTPSLGAGRCTGKGRWSCMNTRRPETAAIRRNSIKIMKGFW